MRKTGFDVLTYALCKKLAGEASAQMGAQMGANIAPAYDGTATYAVGDFCMQGGKLYKCTTAVEAAEAFDPTKWTQTTITAEL